MNAREEKFVGDSNFIDPNLEKTMPDLVAVMRRNGDISRSILKHCGDLRGNGCFHPNYRMVLRALDGLHVATVIEITKILVDNNILEVLAK